MQSRFCAVGALLCTLLACGDDSSTSDGGTTPRADGGTMDAGIDVDGGVDVDGGLDGDAGTTRDGGPPIVRDGRADRLGVNVGFLQRLQNGEEHVFAEGFDPTTWSAGEPIYDPAFLEVVRPFSVLRFHQFQLVSFSTEVEWSDRQAPDSDFLAPSGEDGAPVPWEFQIELCNAVDADCWLTVPALASPDYVRQLATLVHERLEPGLRVIVEYSNEVWNSQYADGQPWDEDPVTQSGQHTVAGERGMAMWGEAHGWEEDDTWFAVGYYYVHASVRLWHVFDEVFGDDSARVVRALSWILPERGPEGEWDSFGFLLTALGDSRVNQVDGTPVGLMPHMLAVNPYFNFPEEYEATPPATEADWSALSGVVEALDGHLGFAREVLDSNGMGAVSLVGYEAGQHLLGEASASMNRDERMYDLYRRWIAICDTHTSRCTTRW